MSPNTILWIYIVLLVAGGVIGFLKAKSRVSLIASVVFAALLLLYHPLGIVRWHVYPDLVITVLLVFFGIRYSKTGKFMPAGLMAIASIAAIVLRNIPAF